MHSGTPKIRFGIAPGTSARKAEQDREVEEVPSKMRIQAGTAARMAEAEKSIAGQSPYGIQIQARAGKPFSASDASAFKMQSAQSNLQTDTASYRLSKESLREPDLERTSFKPLIGQGQAFAQTQNVANCKGDFNSSQDKNKETPKPSISPFKKLRALFSRSLPETGVPGKE